MLAENKCNIGKITLENVLDSKEDVSDLINIFILQFHILFTHFLKLQKKNINLASKNGKPSGTFLIYE